MTASLFARDRTKIKTLQRLLFSINRTSWRSILIAQHFEEKRDFFRSENKRKEKEVKEEAMDVVGVLVVCLEVGVVCLELSKWMDMFVIGWSLKCVCFAFVFLGKEDKVSKYFHYILGFSYRINYFRITSPKTLLLP